MEAYHPKKKLEELEQRPPHPIRHAVVALVEPRRSPKRRACRQGARPRRRRRPISRTQTPLLKTASAPNTTKVARSISGAAAVMIGQMDEIQRDCTRRTSARCSKAASRRAPVRTLSDHNLEVSPDRFEGQLDGVRMAVRHDPSPSRIFWAPLSANLSNS